MVRGGGTPGTAKYYQAFAAATGANITSTTLTSILEELKKLRDEQQTIEETIKQVTKALFQQIAQLTTSFALLQTTSQLYAMGPAGVFAGTLISTLGGYIIGQGVQEITGGIFGP